MKNIHRLVRYAGLIMVLFAVISLSGCVANPDNGNGQGTGGQGSELPFPVLTPEATSTPDEPQTIQPIVTPSPSATDGGQVLPWGGTPVPGAFVTPTSTGFAIVTQMPTMTPAPTATVYVLKVGSKGEDVRKLQRRLKELGYYSGSADGDFGTATETAVKSFQRRNNLTADGIAGNATTTRLYSKNAVRSRPTPSPTPRATATPKINQNLYLKLGSSGRDVTNMQARLIDLGYLSGSPTGRFDSATEKAIYAFQRRNVAYSDGVAGPLTLKALYSSGARGTSSSSGVVGVSLRKGLSNSDAVRNMQSRLKKLGYYNGGVDGDFGASTEAAVKAFQNNNNLRADGVAGEGTLNKLYSDEARSARYSPATATPRNIAVTPIPKSTPVTNYVNVTPSPNNEYVTLREGHSGTLVRNLQQALKDQGYLSGYVDGKYGNSTVEAVVRFQQNNGLSQDGVAGPATQRVLFEGNYPAGS